MAKRLVVDTLVNTQISRNTSSSGAWDGETDAMRDEHLRDSIPVQLVNVETVRSTHFNLVLPKLQSLLPQSALSYSLGSPLPRLDMKRLAPKYFELLFVSLCNNFAALSQYPISSVLHFVKTDIGKQRFLRHACAARRPRFLALAESLFRCAVGLGEAVFLDFLLSQKHILGLDPNAHQYVFEGRAHTLVE